jgi:hypothetical protein
VNDKIRKSGTGSTFRSLGIATTIVRPTLAALIWLKLAELFRDGGAWWYGEFWKVWWVMMGVRL